MRLIFRASVVAALAVLLASCNTEEVQLGYYAIEHREACMDGYTVDCVTLRVEYNVLAFRSAIDAARAERSTTFKKLEQGDFEAGIRALAHGIELNEDDRPNFLSRWFFGEHRPLMAPKLEEVLVSIEDIQYIFFNAVVTKREREGKDVENARAILEGTEDQFTAPIPAPPAGATAVAETAATAAAEASAAADAAEAAATTMEAQRPTLAPSFDCAEAASPVEHMICTSDRLADLDNRVADTYRQLTRDFGVVPKLIASQRTWISQRDACANAKCVEAAYDDRLTVLANVRVYGSGDVDGL